MSILLTFGLGVITGATILALLSDLIKDIVIFCINKVYRLFIKDISEKGDFIYLYEEKGALALLRLRIKYANNKVNFGWRKLVKTLIANILILMSFLLIVFLIKSDNKKNNMYSIMATFINILLIGLFVFLICKNLNNFKKKIAIIESDSIYNMKTLKQLLGTILVCIKNPTFRKEHDFEAKRKELNLIIDEKNIGGLLHKKDQPIPKNELDKNEY